MNAVDVAEVAAVWMMLFWIAFWPRVFAAVTYKNSAPMKAASTLTFGPMPSFSTM